MFSSRHHSSRYPDMTAGFRPTLNAPDGDPYFWLGDVEGERTPAWATSQSARTLEHFGGTRFKRDHDALTAIFDRPDKIPLIARRARTSTISGKIPEIRGLRRRTTLTAYSADPACRHEAGRLRPSGATRLRWPQSCNSWLSLLLLRARRGRPRLTARQSGAGRIHCSEQQFPSQCDPLATDCVR